MVATTISPSRCGDGTLVGSMIVVIAIVLVSGVDSTILVVVAAQGRIVPVWIVLVSISPLLLLLLQRVCSSCCGTEGMLFVVVAIVVVVVVGLVVVFSPVVRGVHFNR